MKIQLTDVTKTWWKSEKARLGGPIAWKIFSDGFYARFFPLTALDNTEQRFIKLRQESRTVDVYAIEFSRLNKFSSNLMAEKRENAHRLQQGLSLEI